MRLIYSPFSLATFMAPHKPKQSGRCHGGNMVARIGHQELLACNRNGRAERRRLCKQHRSVRRLTPTRIQTQAGMRNRPRTHAKRLNQDSVVLGVGKPSGTRRGAAEAGETRFKSDSRAGRAILKVTSNLT